jgi:hypothetical protein
MMVLEWIFRSGTSQEFPDELEDTLHSGQRPCLSERKEGEAAGTGDQGDDGYLNSCGGISGMHTRPWLRW